MADTGQLESLFHWTAGPDEDPSDAHFGQWFLDDSISGHDDLPSDVLNSGHLVFSQL